MLFMRRVGIRKRKPTELPGFLAYGCKNENQIFLRFPRKRGFLCEKCRTLREKKNANKKEDTHTHTPTESEGEH